jgi:Flp pilus assembly protein TadD
LLTLKRYDEALATLDRAIALNPEFPHALFNRGNALSGLKRYADALVSYDKAIALSPGFQEALYNRGNALKELDRYADALESFERALAVNPGDCEAHNSRGCVLQGLQRDEEALQSFDRALALKPDYVEALYNRGNVLKDLWRCEEALQSYDRALAFKPDHIEALVNRGNVLQDLGRFDEALASYARALALEPDYAAAHWNESLCRLRTGDFEMGWRKYEWGWETGERGRAKRDFPQPLWLGGQPLNGKAILLHAEQGLGDTLQFCRYAPLVAKKGAKVLLEVPPSLKTLLKHMDGVHGVLATGETLPAFDYHCPLLSLPLAFHTVLQTIPAPGKYIYGDEVSVAAWQNRLGKKVGPRIGLVWSGNAGQRNDRNRAIPLADFVTLLAPGLEYISLQKEVRPADKSLLDVRKDIAHFGGDLRDFADTAALIELVDLVITIDTSAAHLAGAMGKTVWILISSNADFRWLLDRDDSPWYPSARLFRQPALGDWNSVLTKVKRELEDWVAIRH